MNANFAPVLLCVLGFQQSQISLQQVRLVRRASARIASENHQHVNQVTETLSSRPSHQNKH